MFQFFNFLQQKICFLIGTYGEIYATENLVTFIDAILQFVIFGTFKKRVLELPSRLHRVVIDPHKYKELKQSLSKDQSEYRVIGNFFLFEKPQSSKASVKNFFFRIPPNQSLQRHENCLLWRNRNNWYTNNFSFLPPI